MARTILYEGNLSKYFWTEAVNTACYILNRVLISQFLRKPPMNFEMKENQTLVIFIYLDVNVLF